MPSLRSLALAAAWLFAMCVCAQANDPQHAWSYETGLDYLFLSYAAYCPLDTLQTWTCKWCNASDVVPQTFLSDPQYDTFGFVGYSQPWNQIIVSFRGTHNLENWIVDLQFGKMSPYQNYTGVLVHDGFSKAWANLREPTLDAVRVLLEKYDKNGPAVVVTGHSLGAALATLAAIDIKTSLPSAVYVWDYGSPRVGNQNFARLFSAVISIHYRHTNNRDIVPHLPPEMFGFYHCPTEVWERGTAPTDFTVCSSQDGEDKACSDGLLVDMSISDHLNYFGYHESCT